MRGESELFGNLSFHVRSGTALAVRGANGSGKTTLLRMLCGLSLPEHGRVAWNGCDIRRLREEYRGNLVYIGHASGQKEDLLAWENLRAAAALGGLALDRAQARQALEQVGLRTAAWLPGRALSQGQKKRLALARLCCLPAKPLWILDEPFAALDDEGCAMLDGLLEQYLRQGGIVVAATHRPLALDGARIQELQLGRARPC